MRLANIFVVTATSVLIPDINLVLQCLSQLLYVTVALYQVPLQHEGLRLEAQVLFLVVVKIFLNVSQIIYNVLLLIHMEQ